MSNTIHIRIRLSLDHHHPTTTLSKVVLVNNSFDLFVPAANMSSLWIINKAGGLIYQSEHFIHPNAASMPNNGRLSSNEYLVLAGTLHGIHAITAKLNPVSNQSCGGIESLDSDYFTIKVMVTTTGKQFPLSSSFHLILDTLLT
uniref:Trafficking protein particle complex subunit n=1 Tax=Melanopsichium pennsylvanicum 4 TaxID=1398559 RepID=A0A077QRW0_9BASI|nr:conserved hypothetical protein [Melanopsichium pennsylvanicum 4]